MILVHSVYVYFHRCYERRGQSLLNQKRLL